MDEQLNTETPKKRVAWNKGKKSKYTFVGYTDGKRNIRIRDTETPPDGFYRGRLSKPLSPEKALEANEKRRQTCIERYGNPTYNNMEKNKQTKLERYGDENFNNRDKCALTCIDKYGVDNVSKIDEVKTILAYKASLFRHSEETKQYLSKLKTGVLFSKELRDKKKAKEYETKKKNNSFNTSKPEEQYYQTLCDEYGVDNVIRLYMDERYPYHCDFYIKSEDLFIELNLHWTHGGHPFDSTNPVDLELVNFWKSKASDSNYYAVAITVWTVWDVHKQEIAKENNLNYKVIYKL